MRENQRNLAIFIFSWKMTDATHRVLAQLKSVQLRNISIRIYVLVNDAGVEKKMLSDNVITLKFDKHIGIGKSSYLAYNEVKDWADLIMRYDNDFELHDYRSIKSLVDLLLSKHDAGAITCKLLYPDGNLNYARIKYSKYGGVMKMEDSFATTTSDTFLGAFVILKVEALKTLGRMFDPEIILFGEELELSLALKANGYSLLYEPSVIGTHKTKAVIKEGVPLYEKLAFENQLYILRKHHGWANSTIFYIRSILINLKKGNWHGIKMNLSCFFKKERISITEWNEELAKIN